MMFSWANSLRHRNTDSEYGESDGLLLMFNVWE